MDGEQTLSAVPTQSIGVGKCPDLGGDIFFKQLKDDFLVLLYILLTKMKNNLMSIILLQ